MTAWITTAQIGRDEMSLAPLYITNPTDSTCPYFITRPTGGGGTAMGPGAVTYRRTTVQSPFVAGRYVTNRVKDVVTMNINVRVRALTTDWMDYYIQQLIVAFEQYAYSYVFTMDGVNHWYLCETADWALGDSGQIIDLEARSYTQEVKFIVPRSPIPVAGRF